MFFLYAKEWGINELIFVGDYDARRDAEADKRRYEKEYPDDSMGWPCRYIISTEPPQEELYYGQEFSNTQVL